MVTYKSCFSKTVLDISKGLKYLYKNKITRYAIIGLVAFLLLYGGLMLSNLALTLLSVAFIGILLTSNILYKWTAIIFLGCTLLIYIV